MTIQRISPQQIATDVPLEIAREACYRVLVKLKFSGVLIDREKNVVAGSRGSGFSSRDETAWIAFESGQLTTISVKSESIVNRGFDFGRAKRRAKKMADAIEIALAAPQPVSQPIAAAPQVLAPIAAPTGESSYLSGAPQYGTVMPVKRGAMVLTYALLGLLLIHIFSPFAWVYANRALKDYGEVDPGDKNLLKIGRIIAIVGTVVLAMIWCFWAWTLAASK